MAIVPTPNTPGVTSARAGPTISGDAMAAPGRALQALGGSLRKVAGAAKAHEDKKEKLAEETYKTELSMSTSSIDTKLDIFNDTFNEQTSRMPPADIRDFYDELKANVVADAQSDMVNMRPEDQRVAQHNLDLAMKAMDSHAMARYRTRLFETEIAAANDTMTTHYPPQDEFSEAKVSDAENTIKRHFPDPAEHEPKLRKMRAAGAMDFTVRNLRSAQNLVDVQVTMHEWEKLEGEHTFTPGQKSQIDNEVRGINAGLAREQRTILKSIEDGTATPEQEEEWIALGKVDQAQVDKANNDRLKEKDKETVRIQQSRFRTSQWPSLHKEIKSLFDNVDGANPRLMSEKMKQLDELINSKAPNSAARAYAQSQASALVASAVQGEDTSRWWIWGDSIHQGEMIEEELGPEVADAARQAYGEGLSQMAVTLEKGGNYNIPMAEVFTQWEETIVSAFSQGTPKPEDLRSLTDSFQDRVVDEIVRDRIVTQVSDIDRQAATEWLKNNPNDPQAEAVRQKLGTVDLF